MKITEIKKDVNNIELYKIAAKNLGLKTESVLVRPGKTLLHVTNGKKFFLVSAAAPGLYPQVHWWNGHFTGSKLLAQKILKQLGYKVISSKEVRVNLFNSAKEISDSMKKGRYSFPILVKPDRGMNAKNISILEDKTQLAKVAEKHFKDNNDFLIQPIISSEQTEYRITIVNNEMVIMHSKETYHVKGDGKSTIKELISKIDSKRTDSTCIAWQHKKLGTQPSTILEKGAKFEFHLTRGAIDAKFYKTKNFPPAVKKWALQLAKDVSSPVLGIDVFIPGDFKDTNSYTIVELNTNPGLHYFVVSFGDGKTGIRIFEKVLRDFFKI